MDAIAIVILGVIAYAMLKSKAPTATQAQAVTPVAASSVLEAISEVPAAISGKVSGDSVQVAPVTTETKSETQTLVSDEVLTTPVVIDSANKTKSSETMIAIPMVTGPSVYIEPKQPGAPYTEPQQEADMVFHTCEETPPVLPSGESELHAIEAPAIIEVEPTIPKVLDSAASASEANISASDLAELKKQVEEYLSTGAMGRLRSMDITGADCYRNFREAFPTCDIVLRSPKLPCGYYWGQINEPIYLMEIVEIIYPKAIATPLIPRVETPMPEPVKLAEVPALLEMAPEPPVVTQSDKDIATVLKSGNQVTRADVIQWVVAWLNTPAGNKAVWTTDGTGATSERLFREAFPQITFVGKPSITERYPPTEFPDAFTKSLFPDQEFYRLGGYLWRPNYNEGILLNGVLLV